MGTWVGLQLLESGTHIDIAEFTKNSDLGAMISLKVHGDLPLLNACEVAFPLTLGGGCVVIAMSQHLSFWLNG